MVGRVAGSPTSELAATVRWIYALAFQINDLARSVRGVRGNSEGRVIHSSDSGGEIESHKHVLETLDRSGKRLSRSVSKCSLASDVKTGDDQILYSAIFDIERVLGNGSNVSGQSLVGAKANRVSVGQELRSVRRI